MSRIKGWSKLGKDTNTWKRKNKSLGKNADVVVWEQNDGDIVVTLYKSNYGYRISVDGSDQSRVSISRNQFVNGNIKQKNKAEKIVVDELRKNPNPMGLLAEEDKYEVYTVSVGQYHTQGMGAPKYAKDSAKRLAEKLEKEYGVETAVGDVEDRKSRSHTEGGNYGGYVPIYADQDLTEEEIREVKYNE